MEFCKILWLDCDLERHVAAFGRYLHDESFILFTDDGNVSAIENGLFQAYEDPCLVHGRVCLSYVYHCVVCLLLFFG